MVGPEVVEEEVVEEASARFRLRVSIQKPLLYREGFALARLDRAKRDRQIKDQTALMETADPILTCISQHLIKALETSIIKTIITTTHSQIPIHSPINFTIPLRIETKMVFCERETQREKP